MSDCANYRPISLLNAGYKLFALILLNRLRSSNIDSKLWHSQFGFKRGANVSDAIFVARRLIDKTFADKDSRLVLLALDWAKAFDSIMPEPMFAALSRFGLPDQFVHMVRNIYSSRSFFVHDHAVSSSCKSQHSGISQGCPLSPVLFVIVMSILIADARYELHSKVGHLADQLSDILYADDTLIIDYHGELAETYMYCIRDQGMYYGLDFNWTKIMYLSINCNPCI